MMVAPEPSVRLPLMTRGDDVNVKLPVITTLVFWTTHTPLMHVALAEGGTGEQVGGPVVVRGGGVVVVVVGGGVVVGGSVVGSGGGHAFTQESNLMVARTQPGGGGRQRS